MSALGRPTNQDQHLSRHRSHGSHRVLFRKRGVSVLPVGGRSPITFSGSAAATLTRARHPSSAADPEKVIAPRAPTGRTDTTQPQRKPTPPTKSPTRVSPSSEVPARQGTPLTLILTLT